MQSFAVVIFFVLSGYLITSTVMRKWDTPGFGFGTYLIDRVARVVYPLLPATALIVAFDFLVFRGSTALPFIAIDLGLPTLAAAFTLLYNHPLLQQLALRNEGLGWLDAGPVGTGAPLWSIVAEWWIYVAFGLLVLVFAKGRRLNLGWIALLAFAAAVPVGYFAQGSAHVVAWIVGMIFALNGPQLSKLPRQFHLCLFFVSSAAFLAALNHVSNNLSTPLTILPASIAFCAAYFAVASGSSAEHRIKPVRGAEWLTRLIVFISGYSYSLYLVHFSVTTYLWYFFNDDLRAWQLLPLAFVLSNAAGFAFWFLVERHFHRVGRMLKPAVRTPGASPRTRELVKS
jgi:peptidoglycan/LPS O-acetylase OafA/YrhL